MNYPFREAILAFLRGWEDSRAFADRIMTVAENYPRQVLQCNMNLLGTHDTPRILTELVDDRDGSREELASRCLTSEQRRLAKKRLLAATVLQFTLPGSPGIYYADEAGMEGGKDPFNRRTYPWGREDPELLRHYRQLGQLRKDHPALRLGDIAFFSTQGGKLGYRRSLEGSTVRIYVNRSEGVWDISGGTLLLGHELRHMAPGVVSLAPGGWCITEE